MSAVSRHTPRRAWGLIQGASVLLILLLALLQGAGSCWSLERALIHLLPSPVSPKAPRVAILELEKGDGGEFAEMDAALALRGLEQLHPRSVTILGTVKRGEDSMDVLRSMLLRFREGSDHFPVMIPVIPSSDARYAPLSLPGTHPDDSWPTLAGRSENESEGSFVTEADPQAGIPLFGKMEAGGGVGSLWWRTLITTIPPAAQSRLLLGRVLLPSNHSAIRITASGRFESAGYPCVRTPLDEFLLRVEQRERGSNSPGFDGIWSDTVVVIGTAEDLPKVETFQSLLEQASLARLAPWLQLLFALLGIAALILLPGRSLPFRLSLSLLIVISAGLASFLLLRNGILFPWIPSVVSSLLILLLPSRGANQSGS